MAVRLPCHLAAAAVAVVVALARKRGSGDPAAIAVAAVAFLAIAWMTNLFNFMDGADGLAGGMAADRLRRRFAFAAWRGGRPGARRRVARARRGGRGVPRVQLPAGAGVHGRRGLGARSGSSPARWAGWARRAGLAGVVPGARVLAVHRRRHGDARAAGGGRRAVPGARTGRTTTSGWSWAAGATGASPRRTGPSWRARPRARSPRCGQRPPRCKRGIIFAWAIAYGAALVAIDRRHPRRGHDRRSKEGHRREHGGEKKQESRAQRACKNAILAG